MGGVAIKIAKNNAVPLAPALARIINLSLQSGILVQLLPLI